jgi:cytidylate kinase
VRVENLLIISMYNEILEALARRGKVVILSRVGFAVLGGLADAFNVRVVAPTEQRIEKVMAAEGLADASAAEERLRDDDAADRRFVERFYNRRRDDAAAYGLVVNTGSMPVEDAAQRIVDAARAAFAAPAASASARTTADIDVDPVLASAIEEVVAAPVPGAAG